MKNSFKILCLLFLVTFFISCGVKTKGNESAKQEEVKVAGTLNKKSEAEELSISPRHHEWVTLSAGEREFEAFVVYPETSRPAKAVIVIHENRGLNDWARLFADKLAAEGFLVIAPDLISNTKGKKRTTDFENPDAARDAIYDLDRKQVTADLDAAYQYIKNDPASTGKVAVIGFCWGGSQTFRYATNNAEITSAHVFYGTAPDDAAALAQISAPVFGYYGGEDNRVNSTIENTQNLMDLADNPFIFEIYEGAGHAFMRSGHQPDASAANKLAHDLAWKRLLELLKDN